MYFVYFALSLKNKKVYVGRTSKKPSLRVTEHNKGGSAWTKNNRPFKLIYFEEYICKRDAVKREIFYKTGIGKKIKKLIVKIMDR